MAEDVFEIVGTVVGGSFNVEAVVAEGGFAVVYRAYHGAFHAQVALKCLKVPTVRRSDQREFLERFREEGELMFRLSQSIPSVVRPLHVDAFESASGVFVPYMALEWLDGETLDVVIARRRAEGLSPMSPKRVVRLLAPVARALERAHKFPSKEGPVSIVHRDLKPDNIVVAMVNHEEVVKILDFGIAKVKSVATQVAGRQSQDGESGGVPFTPGYAAPEQWFPKRYGQSGPWTDIWGLALCAVEAMSGRPAIDGDHAAMMGTAVDERRRPSPANEGVRVSDEVESIFLKALAVDPRHRYDDVGRFWTDLESALNIPSSRGSATGYAPQPYSDPRSEGPPPLMEERIEAADIRQRKSKSLRPPGAVPMTRDQKSAETSQDGHVPSSQRFPGPARLPSHEVPDLEFELGKPAKKKAKPPPPPPPKPRVESAVAAKPPEASSPAPEEKKPDAPKAANQGPPGVEHGFTGSMVQGLGDKAAEPSGIDLAVSPQDVRRVSSAGMRAVRVGPPPPATPPEGIALANVGKPPTAVRTGSYSASGRTGKSPVVSAQSPSRRLALPIVLAAVGMAIALAYYINASMGGGRWALGPVPVNWIAGLLAVAGTAMLLLRLFWPMEE